MNLYTTWFGYTGYDGIWTWTICMQLRQSLTLQGQVCLNVWAWFVRNVPSVWYSVLWKKYLSWQYSYSWHIRTVVCVHEVVYRRTSSQAVAQEPYTQVHLETILQNTQTKNSLIIISKNIALLSVSRLYNVSRNSETVHVAILPLVTCLAQVWHVNTVKVKTESNYVKEIDRKKYLRKKERKIEWRC